MSIAFGRLPLGRRCGYVVAVLVVAMLVLAGAVSPEVGAETPRRGGELVYVVGAEPPSFDAHRETTFAMLHPIRPHYNLLVKFDLESFPEVVGDLAKDWTVSEDGLTYTFRIWEHVKWHDGDPLTSRDIKATYEKIIFPPEGVASVRQATYSMVDRIEAPDDYTVVFHLKYPSGAFLANLASPFNWVYKADILEEDPRWYETNVMGTGPFVFEEYVRGSHWSGRRNEAYFKEGLPYLDSFRAVFIADPSAQVAAVRGGRAHIQLRGFSPSQRDDLVRSLGDRIKVQENSWLCNNTVVPNSSKPPFDDPRVRRALNLALDRWAGSEALSQIAIVGPVGALFRPGAVFALSDEELVELEGFGRDIEAARAEARRLLQEAGVPEGFSFKLLNRDVREPYEAIGVFVIDQWRRIGLNVEHDVKESASYLASFRAGDYDVGIDFTCDFLDEPDVQLHKFVSTDISPANYGHYTDRVLDELYERQSREQDPEERMRIVREFERRVIEQGYQFHVLWWYRIIPYSADLQGYHMSPAHHLEPDIEAYWLAQ